MTHLRSTFSKSTLKSNAAFFFFFWISSMTSLATKMQSRICLPLIKADCSSHITPEIILLKQFVTASRGSYTYIQLKKLVCNLQYSKDFSFWYKNYERTVTPQTKRPFLWKSSRNFVKSPLSRSQNCLIKWKFTPSRPRLLSPSLEVYHVFRTLFCTKLC
jgi:hypothetical protein